MTKLPNTSETAIAVTFLVMNLSTGLERIGGRMSLLKIHKLSALAMR